MRPFVLCRSCGKHLLKPESLDDDSYPEGFLCTDCGGEFFGEPIPIEAGRHGEKGEECEMQIIPIPPLELEIDEEVAAKPERLRAPDWSVLGPNLRRPRPREVSAVRKIIPPVLGGLAAFPIATLIMWYGFGRDIGSAGPVVGEYVPWIVPEKLRKNPTGYSTQDSRAPRNRSNAWSRRSFPSLDSGISSDVAAKKAAQDLMAESSNWTSEFVEVSPPASDIIVDSISETMARLRSLQRGWYDVPEVSRPQLVGDYYTTIRQLSEQSSALSGRSAAVWRRELESIAKEILSHSNIPKAIQRGAIGELPGISPASMHDFVATVILLGAENKPSSNTSWFLQEQWPYCNAKLTIEVLPGAWRADAAVLPARCLVFGKLLEGEPSQTDMILQVHSLLPQ